MELNFSGFEQHFLREGKPFIPRIYSGEGEVPDGFNAVLVTLDASEHASLKWDLNLPHSLILWELDFALDSLHIEDEARFLSLELAVDHFTKTVWPQEEARTIGVVLYRGPLIDLDPIKWLASHLPESVRPFVLIDTTAITDPATYFRTVNQIVFGPLIPILKGPLPEQFPFALPALGWGHAHSPLGALSNEPLLPLEEKRITRALYLPEEGNFPIPPGDFRVIPEQLLTHEWDGIDQLILDPSSISARARRKLHGFCAAGGELVEV